ncbi:Uncharacterised protein [uncultured archaeon]|nr:Uncharacterised protein [uncultured archaeon]
MSLSTVCPSHDTGASIPRKIHFHTAFNRYIRRWGVWIVSAAKGRRCSAVGIMKRVKMRRDYGNEGAKGEKFLESSSLEEPLVYIYQQTD